jgi:Cu(I)/Ag(I) efflux system membrane fusion protein
MKKVLITATLSIVLGLGAGWLIFHPGQPGNSSQERKILYYRDPMNPQITSPTPKKAPDGMDYVPVYDESKSPGGERKIAYYKDPMHPWYTSDKPGKAPDCGMDLVPVYEGESDTKGIKIDPVTVQNIGVRVETVERRKLNRTIRTTGTVTYDERKIYSVNSKIMGWVEKLYVDYTGMVVRKGEPLMELYSPELVTTQQEYLQALQYQKKLQSSSLDEARQGSDDLVQSSKRRLLYWDIPESEINELEKRGTPKKTMTIFAPVDGIVMEKMVQKGQNIDEGMELFKIADLSTVWVMADVYQNELPWVKLGQSVDIELSYLGGKSFKGKITFVYPYLNEETKTVKVRVEVPNTHNIDLKPEMFATVKIASPVAVEAVAVPDQAIIRSGERTIAVIALGGGYFDPREVKLGVSADGYDEVLDGIKAGEKIVTSSQFLIDSESNLKAAVSQMSGHAGMDMSKPMEQGKPSPAVQSDSMASMPMGSSSKPRKLKSGKKGRQIPRQEKKKMDDMQMDMKEGADSVKTSDTETVSNAKVEKRIDPVCGMDADPSGKYSFAYESKTYYFCSEEDMEKFKKEPDKYATHDHVN